MILQFCRRASRKFRWSLFQNSVLLRLNGTEPIIVVIGTVCEDVWRATLHLLLIQQTHTGPCRDRPIGFWSYCSWFWHLLRLQDIRLRCTGTWYNRNGLRRDRPGDFPQSSGCLMLCGVAVGHRPYSILLLLVVCFGRFQSGSLTLSLWGLPCWAYEFLGHANQMWICERSMESPGLPKLLVL